MLATIEGVLVEKEADSVIIQVGGFGIKVLIPFSTYEALDAVGEVVLLKTHLNVKEDGITLYGFQSSEEKELFRMLLKVSKIGPKVALGILSHISTEGFITAVNAGDVDRLTAISGIGRKTATRLIVEFKDSLPEPSMITDIPDGMDLLKDGIEALATLGYSRSEATKAVRKAMKDPEMPLENLIKDALKHV